MVSLGNCCGDEVWCGGGEGRTDLERTKPRFMSVNTRWEQTQILKEPLHAYRRRRRCNWMTVEIVSVSAKKKKVEVVEREVEEEKSLEWRCSCLSRETGGNRDVRVSASWCECECSRTSKEKASRFTFLLHWWLVLFLYYSKGREDKHRRLHSAKWAAVGLRSSNWCFLVVFRKKEKRGVVILLDCHSEIFDLCESASKCSHISTHFFLLCEHRE